MTLHASSPHAGRHLPAPRHVTAGRCLEWLLAGWQVFIVQPWLWLLMGLLTFLALLVCVLLAPWIPVLGPMLPPVAFILSIAGMLKACSHQATGGTPEVVDTLKGMQTHTVHLVLLGVFFSLPLVLLALLTYLAIGGGLLVGLLGAALGNAVQGIAGGLAAFATFLLSTWTVFLIAWSLLLLALLFAPALIIFHDATPLDAMRASFAASMKSLGAILAFGALLYVLFLLVLASAGLGAVLFIPVFACALHRAYRDIFDLPAAAPAVAAPD